MGVNGLWKLLEPCGAAVPTESLHDQTVAVDVSIWLNQAMKGYRDSHGQPLTNAHLLCVFSRVCKLLTYRVRPVFVFDGAAPALKVNTLATRRLKKQSAAGVADRSSSSIVHNMLKQEALRAVLGEDAPLPHNTSSSAKTPASRDMFELPSAHRLAVSKESDDTDSSDSEADFIASKSYANMYNFDFDSDKFHALPSQVKHDILSELNDTRKQNSWARLDEMPGKSGDFSQFQMGRLLKRKKFQDTMEGVESEITKQSNAMLQLGVDLTETISVRKMASRADTYLVMGKVKPAGSTESTKKSTTESVDEAAVDDEVLTQAADMSEYLTGSDLASIKSANIPSAFRDRVRAGANTSHPEISSKSSNSTMFLRSPSKYTIGLWPSSMSQIPCNDNVSAAKGSMTDDSVEVSNEKSESAMKSSVGRCSKKLLDDRKNDSCGNQNTPAPTSNHSPYSGNLVISIDPSKFDNSDDMFADVFMSDGDSESDETPTNGELNCDIRLPVGTRCEQSSCADERHKLISRECNLNAESSSDEDKDMLSKNEDLSSDNDKHGNLISSVGDKPDKLILSTEDIVDSERVGSLVEMERCANEESVDCRFSSTIIDANSPDPGTDSPPRSCGKVHSSDHKDVFNTEDEMLGCRMTKDDPDLPDIRSTGHQSDCSVPGSSVEYNVSNDLLINSSLTSDETNNPKNDCEFPISLSRPIDSGEFKSSWGCTGVASSDQLRDLASKVSADQLELLKERGRQERLAASVTQQMYSEIQLLLQLFGIPYVVAPSEAEAQCAFLEAAGLTNATITDDSDIWLFGGRQVYKNFFNQNKYVERYRVADIERVLGVSRGQLVCVAMLSGSDYTTGVDGVGCVRALEILSEFPGSNIGSLVSFRRWWQRVGEGAEIANTALQRTLSSLRLPDNFPSSAVENAYLQPLVDESREPFSWAQPDLDALRHLAATKLGWSVTHTDSVLQPVIKRLQSTCTQTRLYQFFSSAPSAAVQGSTTRRIERAVRRLKDEDDPPESQRRTHTSRRVGKQTDQQKDADISDGEFSQLVEGIDDNAYVKTENSSTPKSHPASHSPVKKLVEDTSSVTNNDRSDKNSKKSQTSVSSRKRKAVSIRNVKRQRNTRRNHLNNAARGSDGPDCGRDENEDDSVGADSESWPCLTDQEKRQDELVRQLRQRARRVQYELKLSSEGSSSSVARAPTTREVRHRMYQQMIRNNPRLRAERISRLASSSRAPDST